VREKEKESSFFEETRNEGKFQAERNRSLREIELKGIKEVQI
jgi:hypothetical protein